MDTDQGSWSRAIAVVIGLFATGFVLSLIPAAVGAIAIGRLGYGLDSGAFVVVSLTATAIGFGVVGAVYIWRWLDEFQLDGLGPDELRWIIGGTILSLFVALGLQVLYEAVGGPSGSALITEAIVTDPSFAATYALVSVFLVAPGEELLFRGAIQERLELVFNSQLAIVGGSLLFAAPHFFNIVGSGTTGLFAVVTIFVVSLVWGTAFHRTENLAVPILIHGLYNTGLALVGYLSVVGVI